MKVRDAIGPVVLFTILFGIAYAFGATTLTFSANVTVLSGTTNILQDVILASATCPSHGATQYSSTNVTSVSITFRALASSGTSPLQFCIDNSNNAAEPIAISQIGLPSTITFGFTPLTVPALSVGSSTVTLTSTNAVAGSYPFTITVT